MCISTSKCTRPSPFPGDDFRPPSAKFHACAFVYLSPSITYDGDDTDNRRSQRISETPPLGILTLAAVLERLSITPVIIHLNRLYREYLAQDCGFRAETSFCAFAASHVAQGFDIIGLGTICSSYPLTLRLAARLKHANPEAAIVLGGPQASAVDVATMESFPSIDIVVPAGG